MPIFEYVCAECEHQFETLVRGEATPECPACHGTRLQKQLSVFAVSTKASGFQAASPAPCGSCGDPRGAGACSMN